MKILFILNARTQSDMQNFLLEGVLALSKHRIEPVFFIQGKDSELEKKLKGFRVRPWSDDAYIIPESGKISSLCHALKKAPYVLTRLKEEQPDGVLACDSSLLTLLSPFCYMSRIPLFWVQETLWQKNYRAGALLGGYTPFILTVSQEIYTSLPPFLLEKARELPPKTDKISAKNYVEAVFKGCI